MPDTILQLAGAGRLGESRLPRRYGTNLPPPVLQEQAAGYGARADGTLKGQGFLGPLQRPDGRVSSELSIGVEMDGREIEIPSLVPTLTTNEVSYLLSDGKPTPEIVRKAVEHARSRMDQGLSPFADTPLPPPPVPPPETNTVWEILKGVGHFPGDKVAIDYAKDLRDLMKDLWRQHQEDNADMVREHLDSLPPAPRVELNPDYREEIMQVFFPEMYPNRQWHVFPTGLPSPLPPATAIPPPKWIGDRPRPNRLLEP